MSTRPGRTRVAVVFGGRSSEHAISCVSAGSVLRDLDRERFDVVPVGIAPDGAWVLAPATPSSCAIPGGELPTVDRGTAVVLPGDPTGGGLVVLEPGRAGPRCSAASTSSSRCCTGRSARTARSRGCWRWPACPTSGAGVLASAGAWTRSSRRSCWSPTACRSATSSCCGRGTPAITEADAARAARPAGVRQARPCRLARRASAGSPTGRARRRDRRGPRARPEGARRGGDRRARDRVRRAGAARRDGPTRASARGDPDRRRGGDFYDFDAKYLDDVRRVRHPGRSSPTT